MTFFTVDYPEIGRCLCGAILRLDSFRDEASHLAFYRTGLCQGCADQAFLCEDPHDPDRRLPLRRGALVAHHAAEDGGVELCALPFLFRRRDGADRVGGEVHRPGSVPAWSLLIRSMSCWR